MKVGIVGSGLVGSTAGYALVMQGVGRELVLVDRNTAGAGAGRVLGSGTTLDTARFRSLLGAHCGVDAHHVHGYLVGEHGGSEVLTWSLVTVAGMPLEAFAQMCRVDFSERARREIDQKV